MCVRACVRAFTEKLGIFIIVLKINLMTALDVTQFKICLQFVFVRGGSTPCQRFYRPFEDCDTEKEQRAV